MCIHILFVIIMHYDMFLCVESMNRSVYKLQENVVLMHEFSFFVTLK